MLSSPQQRVLNAAREQLQSLTGNLNHTVAAAAMDTAGRIYTGVNVFHFTGGPCAELAALGQAAAAGPLVTMVAVGNRGRGVIPPCGRCRQVLLDQHPDCSVIIAVNGALTTVPVRKLLPHTYSNSSTAPERVVRFHPRYYDSVLDSSKTATTRFDDPCAVGPAWLLFEFDDEYKRLPAHISSIEPKRFDQITDEDAQREGGTVAADLQDLLRTHYPAIESESRVDIVHFRVEQVGT
ncbi:ASCH domain-containing protein [Brachybacterium paraconglomeratum]|uniref:ASCH domain-containing protein n=1 Tax=Brachybacterium paraconglomeratum TaxID=173362 RepID=UPI00026C70B5|nr:ASCH domain-containing protein [Brachybacterium paraconglomeratum]MCT1438369.1 ASCH domain-containing protein [Brachybacterium paraconglomeratum]